MKGCTAVLQTAHSAGLESGRWKLQRLVLSSRNNYPCHQGGYEQQATVKSAKQLLHQVFTSIHASLLPSPGFTGDSWSVDVIDSPIVVEVLDTGVIERV